MARLTTLAIFLGFGLLGASCSSPAIEPARLGTSSEGPLTFAQATSRASTRRVDPATGRTYLVVPVGYATAASGSTAPVNFTKDNWNTSLKQQGRVQLYISQTPDWYVVVEQELPRSEHICNTLDEAISYANQHYPTWPLVSLEP